MKTFALRLKTAAGLVMVILLPTGPAAQAQFGPPTRLSLGAGSRPYDVELADLNSDGRPDAITANGRTNSVGVLLNTTAAGAATLSFTPVATSPTGAGTTPLNLAVGDLNGDSRPEVVVASYDTDELVLLPNQSVLAAVAARPATVPPGPTLTPAPAA